MCELNYAKNLILDSIILKITTLIGTSGIFLMRHVKSDRLWFHITRKSLR
jgi:hypothetical protein